MEQTFYQRTSPFEFVVFPERIIALFPFLGDNKMEFSHFDAFINQYDESFGNELHFVINDDSKGNLSSEKTERLLKICQETFRNDAIIDGYFFDHTKARLTITFDPDSEMTVKQA